jgi:hypothetical protein
VPLGDKPTDLTAYAALLGDSFAAKINLLTQIVQGHHYPSIGRYKERLLAAVIREYLPTNYSVGTGFVLFVHEATKERAKKPGFDSMNMGSHSISKQCDILIYDAARIPLIFRDEDFVIVRPESVKAVIEVKGSINSKGCSETLKSFIDFGRKWRASQLFYETRHQAPTKSPALYLMCWDVGKDKDGKPVTDGTKLREQIARIHGEMLNPEELKGFPILERVYLYNECEITRCAWVGAAGEGIKTGWSTQSGKFARHDEKGVMRRSGDRTIASLLASLHFVASEDFNRFYSYVDETHANPGDYSHHGFSEWQIETRHQRDLNSNFVFDPRKQL